MLKKQFKVISHNTIPLFRLNAQYLHYIITRIYRDLVIENIVIVNSDQTNAIKNHIKVGKIEKIKTSKSNRK